MRVEDVGSVAADDLDESRIAAAASASGEISRWSPGIRLDLDASMLGDEGHRCLALGDGAGSEGCRVASIDEALAEVGDVQRRTADIQSCDHPQHADGIISSSEHGCERYRVGVTERTLRPCPY